MDVIMTLFLTTFIAGVVGTGLGGLIGEDNEGMGTLH